MDCNYSIRPGDSELVLKWFLNDELVYQWVPPKQPQSLGILKNRLDLLHKASGDPNTVYRALKIKNPTTDIAGEYKCYVSTLVDEDFIAKTMIVFGMYNQIKCIFRILIYCYSAWLDYFEIKNSDIFSGGGYT